MSIDARFVAYLAVSAVLIVIPGPDMALVTRNALRSGARAASLTAFGAGSGILVWAAASALGVAVLLERAAVAFTVLKLAGAAYLLYLGLHTLVGSFRKASFPVAAGAHPDPEYLARRTAFRQGFLGNLLNPKAAVIFVTILPQFVRPGDSPLRLGLMALAFEAMLLLWLNVYGTLIARAGRSRAGVRIRKSLERVTGVVLLGLSVRLAIESR
jgi:threonine/homoserine/homoserine lactone efflux protein